MLLYSNKILIVLVLFLPRQHQWGIFAKDKVGYFFGLYLSFPRKSKRFFIS